MPRKAREGSGTGIFHVMMRGINHQNIFEDAEDNCPGVPFGMKQELSRCSPKNGAPRAPFGVNRLFC